MQPGSKMKIETKFNKGDFAVFMYKSRLFARKIKSIKYLDDITYGAMYRLGLRSTNL
mgnify:CR=1 FL=1